VTNAIVARVGYIAARVVVARYAYCSLGVLLAKWMADGMGDGVSEMRVYHGWVEDQAFPSLLKVAR
jgi:hypothetical protein